MIIDKLAWIFIHEQKVLVTRSKGKDTWYLPGGKREAGESDTEALVREVFEELGVALRTNTITFYGTFEAQAHGKPEGTMVKMSCYMADYTGELRALAEIAEFDYFGYERKGETSVVDHLIFDDLKSKKLIE
jgi:8-oxo-dGTP diphosphatase